MTAPSLEDGALTAASDDLRDHGPGYPGLDQAVRDVLACGRNLDWLAGATRPGRTSAVEALTRRAIAGVTTTRLSVGQLAAATHVPYTTPDRVSCQPLPDRGLVLVNDGDLVTFRRGRTGSTRSPNGCVPPTANSSSSSRPPFPAGSGGRERIRLPRPRPTGHCGHLVASPSRETGVMNEELSKEELWSGVAVLLKGLGAVVAVGAWALAAQWMLWPVAQNGTSPADSFLPPGYVVCAPPAWDVDERQEWPGCLERREKAPARALTAVVIALPATWLWLGLRVPSSPTRRTEDEG